MGCIPKPEGAVMSDRSTLGIAIGSTEVPFWIARLIDDVRRNPNLELRAVLVFPSKVVKPRLLRACTMLDKLRPFFRHRASPLQPRPTLPPADLTAFHP